MTVEREDPPLGSRYVRISSRDYAEIFCINHGNQRGFFNLKSSFKRLSKPFLLHLNTYVIGLRALEIVYFSHHRSAQREG